MSSQKPPDKAPQLANFASLPYELRARIIEESYLFNRKKHETMFNLLQVSRDVYALVAPEWYRVVRIARPSTLASFLQAVVARPALGQLVTSLWLGPKDLLPQAWWPMGPLHGPDKVFQDRYIATSLSDERLLPRGLSARARWPLTEMASVKLPSRDKAILQAIEVAQIFLGVDLKRPGYSQSGSKIGSTLWLIGVAEVQAALDLYLLEVRRLEDEVRGSTPASQEARSGEGVEYPALRLTTEMPASGHVGDGRGQPFTVHRSRLLEFMQQRGGSADYLDHPVIFARSGIKTVTFTADGRGHLSESLWQHAEAIYEDEQDAFTCLVPPTGAGALLSHDLMSPLDQANHTTASVGGNLHLARLLLSLTTNVKNLFLTGFLQRILCGREASPPPKSLRSLSLGPVFSCADESLSPCYDGGRLANLQELRLRGELLEHHKRACIAALPNIKRVDWDLQHSNEKSKDIINAFRPLVDEARSTTARLCKARQRKRKRDAFERAESPAESVSSRSSSQTPESAGSSTSPMIYISVDSDCETEMPTYFDADALEEWDNDEFSYDRPWRIRVCFSYRYEQYSALEDEERLDLVDSDVARAYADVRTYWSVVDHYNAKTGRGKAGQR